MTALLLAKWDACDRLVKKLAASLSQLAVELYPMHQRLITLRRLLASIAARPRPAAADVQPILAELRAIDEKRVDGKFVVEKRAAPGGGSKSGNQPAAPAGSTAPGSGSGDAPAAPAPAPATGPIVPEKGQALLAGLLQDNFDICEDIKVREGEDVVAQGPLKAIYERLSEIRAQLERLVLTHRWTLRETVSLLSPSFSLFFRCGPGNQDGAERLLFPLRFRTCTTTKTSSREWTHCGRTER